MNNLANGENSFNCQEESCNNPFADSYLNLQDIYSLCQEEAENMKNSGQFKKGHKLGVGRKYSAETLEKMSNSHKGKTTWCKGKKNLKITSDRHYLWGKHRTKEVCRKISERKKGTYMGEDNPFFQHKHTTESKDKMSKVHKGQVPWSKGLTKETSELVARVAKKSSITKKTTLLGKNNPNWRGGLSFEPYCLKFNESLKEWIRNRDDRTCQLCGIKENGKRLAVHHIHYDKENCEPDLISLCNKCNSKVNGKRDYWEKYFTELLINRGLIIKQIFPAWWQG